MHRPSSRSHSVATLFAAAATAFVATTSANRLCAQDPSAPPENVTAESTERAASADTTGFPPIVPVYWDGLDPDNSWVEELPIVTSRGGVDDSRGQRAGAHGDKTLDAWQAMLLKKFDEFVKPVDGSRNPREAAYTMLNVFIGSSLAGAAGTTLAGAGGGSLIGGIITSESGGWGAAPGLALGGGTGLAVGAAGIGSTALAAMLIADEIEQRYPYENGGVRARSLDAGDEGIDLEAIATATSWDDPPHWILEDTLNQTDEAQTAVEASAADVGTRSLDGRKRSRRRSRTSAPRYAGPQESLFVHVIGELVAPKVSTLARHWDRMPGLSRSQRSQLAKLEQPLRSWVRRLDYVRQNRRLSQNAPKAMPLSSWQQSVLKTLSGTANSRVWLEAFAVGSTKVAVQGTNATWTTPRILREFGAPRSFSTRIQPLYARVKGFGGELSGKITPGTFDVEIGSVRVDGNRLRAGIRVRSGKRLADVSVKGKFAGQTRTLLSFKPKLSSSLRGDIFFKIAGTGLAVDAVQIGSLKLSLGIPKITNPVFAPLDGLRKNLESAVKKELRKILGSSREWSKLFGGLGSAAPKHLLDILNRSCDELGIAQVKSLRGIRIRNGKLELNVEALTWKGAPRVDHRRFGGHVRRVFR